MRVYRLISSRELLNVYKGNSERIAVNKGVNTHKYEEGVEYIHFFRYSDDALMYQKSNFFNMDDRDNYCIIMVANIPNEILEKYQGYGEYRYTNKESELCGQYVPICEYAIPLSEFNPEYIISMNSIIPYEYKSNSDEYDYYYHIIGKLLKERINPFEYMKGKKVTDVLAVKDDPRTEDEIMDDKIKKLCKIFREENFW